MQYNADYSRKIIYNELTPLIAEFNLSQVVDFITWSRSVNNNLKKSTLDHVYTNNVELVFESFGVQPTFGDHCIVITSLHVNKVPVKISYRRDWRNYSPLQCEFQFSMTDWNIDCVDVQQYWNILENKIICIVDTLSPIVRFSNDAVHKKNPPRNIKKKLNKRKNLLKKNKIQPTALLSKEIRLIDREIKDHFYNSKRNFIRSKIIPGDNGSLWTAVKTDFTH